MIPVRQSIGGARNCRILGGTRYGPAGLSNPDGLSTGSRDSLVVGTEEKIVCVVDAVGLCVLEVRVGIHSNEITCRNDCIVGSVDPCGPSINVTHESSG